MTISGKNRAERMYTALVNGGSCNLKGVLKSCMGCEQYEYNRTDAMQCEKKQKTINNW